MGAHRPALRKLPSRARALIALLVIAAAMGMLMTSFMPPSIDLDLPDLLDGRTVSLSRLHGQVVVVAFVRTPSDACDQLLESLRSATPASHAAFIAIIENNDDDDALTYARRLGRPFLVVHDAQHDAIARFQARGIPAVYVFDRDGSLYRRHSTPPIDASVVESDLVQLRNR